MKEQEANKLRKIFDESEIFQYYKKHGQVAASNNAVVSLRMKYGKASKAGKAAQPKLKAYRENNKEKWIKGCTRGGVTRGNIHAEKFKNGDPKIVEQVTNWRESGKCKGAKASAEAQIKSGRLGPDSEMSRYKKVLNRIRWAKKLISLKGIEFKASDVIGKYISKKELANIKHLSDLLIITNPGKRYSTFIINEKEVEYWANRPKPIIGEE